VFVVLGERCGGLEICLTFPAELLMDVFVANPDAGFFYSETVRQYEGTNDTVDYGPVWAYGYVSVGVREGLNGSV
jgi:hypothetical protein